MQAPVQQSREKPPVKFLAVRNALRQLEFALPLKVQAPFLRLLGDRYDPYDEASHRTRSIFIHVPRAAGTSIAKALDRSMLHYPISRYAAFDRQRCETYFKFAVVRNPWDRLLSGYSRLRSPVISVEAATWARKNAARYADFEQFVLALGHPAERHRIMSFLHFRPQLSWITLPGRSRIEMDFVGRFESLERDFETVCRKLGIEATLPATNASTHAPYRDSYTPRMRDIVAQVYRDDIAALRYEF